MIRSFIYTTLLVYVSVASLIGQSIYNFTSLGPGSQDTDFHIPSTHTFQYIIQRDVPLDVGGVLARNNDFSGYIPIAGSSTKGYLGINSEVPQSNGGGGVSILDIEYNTTTKLWETIYSQAIDFSMVAGTARNCSGGISPWGTLISCEEASSGDSNSDGFDDIGWCIEIDPITKTVVDYPGGIIGGDKLWGLGKFPHENVVIHPNQRTVYQGADISTGYIFKYVANTVGDLSSGNLYVYSGSKNGNGNWVFVSCWPCGTDPNLTLTQAAAVGGTIFNGVEDIEIDPLSGDIFAAVKGEGIVYRFTDNNPLTGGMVSNFHTYVGGLTTNYNIVHTGGTSVVNWGAGNDNLAFDNAGNLWVFQDGGGNYIWVVDAGHTQSNPKVRIFGRSPAGSEPTGITFTPDNKFMFMSIQHPSANNITSSQLDANLDRRYFDKGIIANSPEKVK